MYDSQGRRVKMLSLVFIVVPFSQVFLEWMEDMRPWLGLERRPMNESLRKIFSMEKDKNGLSGWSCWLFWICSLLMLLVADILTVCGQMSVILTICPKFLCWPSYKSSSKHKAGFCFSMFTHAYFQKRLNSSFIMESLIKPLTAHVNFIRSFDKSSFLSNIFPVSESSLGAY